MDGTLCALELQCDEHRDHNNNAGLEAKRDILGGNALKLFNIEMNGQKLAKVA